MSTAPFGEALPDPYSCESGQVTVFNHGLCILQYPSTPLRSALPHNPLNISSRGYLGSCSFAPSWPPRMPLSRTLLSRKIRTCTQHSSGLLNGGCPDRSLIGLPIHWAEPQCRFWQLHGKYEARYDIELIRNQGMEKSSGLFGAVQDECFGKSTEYGVSVLLWRSRLRLPDTQVFLAWARYPVTEDPAHSDVSTSAESAHIPNEDRGS